MMLPTGNLGMAPQRCVFTNFKDFCSKQVGLSLPLRERKVRTTKGTVLPNGKDRL